jgi:hypothetical protein
MGPIRLRALSAAAGNHRSVAYSTSSAEAPTFSGQSEKRHDVSAFALAYILLLSSCRLMDAFIKASLPPRLTEELPHSRAPSLPRHYPSSHSYYEPIRHPLVFDQLPGTTGYMAYLAPPISWRDEEGFSSCSAGPCHCAVAATPPK